MKQVIRDGQMQLLHRLKDQDVIKVVTGIRRCGKSTLLHMFRDELIKSGVDEKQIFFTNFEDIQNAKWLHDYVGFYNYLASKVDLNLPCYIFLDEIQLVENFERLVDGLFVEHGTDIYITGSNAHILSSEMGTLLTGRYITIELMPFSFAEFVRSKEQNERVDVLFNEYLQSGGFPGIIGFDEGIQNMYISDIYDSILQKDILKRNSWRKTDNFNRIVKFMLDSIGSEVSVNSITKTLKAQGYDISNHTVDNYLSAIVNSYLFYKAPRFDVKGKKILSTGEKYYTVDLGLARIAQGSESSENLGHKLENVVYLELIRRGYKVSVGKVDNTEIDFIAQALNGDVHYYQVAWSTLAEQTFEREVRPFNKVRDFNQRILLTMDIGKPVNYNGIKKINVIDWLLGED